MTIDALSGVEQDIANAKELVQRGQVLNKLLSNRDFKEIVLNGYFEKEAIRLVHLKSDMSMQTEERQKSIVAQIDAIGGFSSYLQLIQHQASLAEKNLEHAEEMREHLLAEEEQ